MASPDDVLEALEPVRGNLHERIAGALQQLIVTQRLQPGDTLPSQTTLANHLGVSKVTLRTSLRMLEQHGLIETRPGSGTYVSEMAADIVVDSIERYSLFGRWSHRELAELRESLEPSVAALAAQRAEPEDLTELERLLDRVEKTFERYGVGEYAAADVEFHMAVTGASHNRIFIAILGGLKRVLRIWIEAEDRHYRVEEGAYSHRRVYDAIVARDPEMAREAMLASLATAPDFQDFPEALEEMEVELGHALPHARFFGKGGDAYREEHASKKQLVVSGC